MTDVSMAMSAEVGDVFFFFLLLMLFNVKRRGGGGGERRTEVYVSCCYRFYTFCLSVESGFNVLKSIINVFLSCGK